jgi:hypothetical protein
MERDMSSAMQNATMVAQAIDFVTTPGLTALATYMGLFFSWLAFKQATRAKEAAKEAREVVYKIDAVSEISKAISLLNEAQNHIRNENYLIVPDKFILANAHIAAVKNGYPKLSGEQKDILINVCTQVYDIKSGIERVLEGNVFAFRKSKANDILSKQTEVLSDFFEKMKRE